MRKDIVRLNKKARKVPRIKRFKRIKIPNKTFTNICDKRTLFNCVPALKSS